MHLNKFCIVEGRHLTFVLTVKEVSLPKSYLVLNNDLRRTYNTLSLGIVMLFNPSATKTK